MSQPNPPPQLEYPYASRPSKQPFVEPIQYPAITWQLGPTWLPLLGVAIVFLMANVAVVPLMDVFDKNDVGAVFVYGCAGIMAGEAFILSAWLAWGGGSFLKRLLLHWAAAIGLSVAWLVGALCSESTSNGDVRDMLEVLPFSAPLFGLAVQLPLWIARQYFGWRLVDSCADRERNQPLAIRDLMLGTVIVAVSLACARLAEGMDRNSEGWLVWAILAPSVAGISLVSVLPVAAWMLHAKNLTTGFICLPI